MANDCLSIGASPLLRTEFPRAADGLCPGAVHPMGRRVVTCILAIPFAAWRGAHGTAAWFAAIVAAEVIVLAVNGWRCPLTSVASRYTDERSANFDNYLPIWPAVHNKQIFGSLYVAGVAFALVQSM